MVSSRFNSSTNALRHANLDGVYDTNTNLMFYPGITQPTHAKWEQIPPPSTAYREQSKHLTNGDVPNGDYHHDKSNTTDLDTPTIFSSIPPAISRNFCIVDTLFASPSISHAGDPGPDSLANGLGSVPDDVLDELPEDCRRAFEQARKAEDDWKRGWGTEKESAMRGDLKVGFSGFPV